MTTARLWPTLVVAGVAATALACAEQVVSAPRVALYTSRDSAGITLLEYRVPDTSEMAVWRIAAEPALLIGDDKLGP